MDNKEKSPEQELIESIGLMLDKGLETNTDVYTGVLKSISGKKAVVTMNGKDQNVAVISSDLLAGMVTRVFVPNGNMSNAFILGSVSGGGDTPTPVKQNDGVAGTYNGSDTRSKTLTFSFEPKFVFIVGVSKRSAIFEEMGFMVKGCPTSKIINSSPYSEEVDVTWGENSVTFSSANYYLNSSINTYYYFAI